MKMERVGAAPRITTEELNAFSAGICYDIYNKLGAHISEADGVQGVYFAVWAPRAAAVSLVGEFNHWDPAGHPMKRLGDSGVYDLFVPGLRQGALYKYAVKQENGEIVLKADPYGVCAELRPNNASVVWNVDGYAWTDGEWIKRRETEDVKAGPMSIYEVHLGTWMRKEANIAGAEDSKAGYPEAGHPEAEHPEAGHPEKEGGFWNYRELAERLALYVKDMGYTHVELLPVMEHPLDASWGFQITGYYAPTSRFGTPEDFQYFVDYLHRQGIGVILDWVPSHFPKDQVGLARFDSTCVYEHLDPRQGENPRWGTLLFNYGRPQVSNFLIANALYWVDKFHADGIRVCSMALMLYLDYDKRPGQWIPNLYGGNENLEAVEFLKHLSSIFHKRTRGTLLIAEESEMWGRVTGDLKDGALGFDYKWNLGWSSDFKRYLSYAPEQRSRHYGEMTYSLLYAYSEDFIVGFTHDDVSNGAEPLLDRMPGQTEAERLANLRAAYGYWMTHPGRKILFMGQDGGGADGGLSAFVRALNSLYVSQPALYELDSHPDGFEWIDCLSSQENMTAFLRKGGCRQETLLAVCNFASVFHEDYRVGVPFEGSWREILCSDDKAFGGEGRVNSGIIAAEKSEWDGREYSIRIAAAPLSVHIFKYVS